MISIKYFALLSTALAFAKGKDQLPCNATSVVDVSPEKFVNEIWYLHFINFDDYSTACDTMQFTSDQKPPTTGKFIDSDGSDKNSPEYNWKYSNGILTYDIGNSDPHLTGYMVFASFKSDSHSKSLVAYNCFKETQTEMKSLVIAASTKWKLSAAELDALNEQARKAIKENGNFNSIRQENCKRD